MVQGSARPLVAGLAILAVSYACGWLMQALPGVGVAQPAGAGCFDEAQARMDLEAFVGDGSARVAGSPAGAAARERLVAMLGEVGLPVERQRMRIERRAGAVELENLVARIPGREAGPAEVAVVAHSDSVPGSPGASDDGAGVACALGVARALVALPPVRDVLLVVTDGEERGLLGAQAFLAQHPAAGRLRAVVNLDARGASGPAFVFETGPETAWLAELLARRVPAVRTGSLMGTVYGAMPNGTDFTAFLKAGSTGFNVAFIGDVAAYHSAADTVERQSAASRRHMGLTSLALVRALDEELPRGAPVPTGRSVFGDVLGIGVLRWPEHWTVWIVGTSAVVLGLVAGRRSARDAALALAVTGGMVAAIAGLGAAFGTGLRLAGASMATAAGRMYALDGLLLAIAVAGSMAAGTVLGRRGVGPWSALLGAWSPWAALAVAAAVTVPGASFPLVVPLASAGAGAIAAVAGSWISGRGKGPAWVPALAGLGAAAVVWLPMGPPIVDALGFHVGWLNGVRAAMVAACVLPLACGTRVVRGAVSCLS